MHKVDNEFEPLTFDSLTEWRTHGPDVGREYHPHPSSLSQSYHDWLIEYPNGTHNH